MVLTDKIQLPSDNELNTEEINITFPILQAAAFHLGKYCEWRNNEFMLCKAEEHDPRQCIREGKQVTSCAIDFFEKLKKNCKKEFNQYFRCIDKSSGNSAFSPCRKTQAVFDKCVLDHFKIERPSFGYFCEVKVHDSLRPKPEKNVIMYPDAAVPLSSDETILPPKYNSRRLWVQ